MRVVVAPDKFAGTLTAVEAAAAIREGWLRQAPGDEVALVPLSDGGPGFLDVVHAALGGRLHAVTVPDPYGDPVPAAFLRVGATAYVEIAQAVGLHLTPPDLRRPEAASSWGAGELIAAAASDGVERVVIGLGGSGVNDGGAGLLAALGALADDDALTRGPAGLESLNRLDLGPARERLSGIEVVIATDVDNPLLGLTGATKVFGPQKGVADERLVVVDGWLQRLADLGGRHVARELGAGTAGGIGYALLLLGARRVAGARWVAELVGLAERLAAADLVITGEGAFDYSSRGGKVPVGVAAIAQEAVVPCVVLAGRVDLGAREMRALGIESAYAVVDPVAGSMGERADSDPAAALADLAARAARSWSRE